MKKRKPLISSALIKSEARVMAEVERRMAMSEAERMHDPKCEILPACIRCGAHGDFIRKAYVPVDSALALKKKGLNGRKTLAFSVCVKCLAEILEGIDRGEPNEQVYLVQNEADMRQLLK